MKPAAFRLPTMRVLRCLRVLLSPQLTTLICLIVFAEPVALGQRSKPTQYDVEAAYLVQFPKFVKWPPGEGASSRLKSFEICVLGRDPYGRILQDAVTGEQIDGLPLVTRQVQSVQDAVECRVLFLSSSENAQLADDLGQLNASPVLTVSELPDFTLHGGMIEFVLIRNRVRFRINISNAERAGLKVSSQLLKVAMAVDRNRGSP